MVHSSAKETMSIIHEGVSSVLVRICLGGEFNWPCHVFSSREALNFV